MAVATAVTPDIVMEFRLAPGGYRAFVDALEDGARPRIKCFQGSVTLVSPGRSHETTGRRLGSLIAALCEGLELPAYELGATLWDLPPGAGKGTPYEKDTGYEADEAYYIQSFEKMDEEPPPMPDLAVEVVVGHSARKALWAGAALGISEMWVLDVERNELAFHGLARRGKHAGSYVPMLRSRALPMLTGADVLELLADPQRNVGAFQKNCRQWAREVLAPRQRAAGKGQKRQD
jgi:Uma2 family endonuclease